MGVAYFIVPEREVPRLDYSVNGRALVRVREMVIERICREAGVRPPLEFFSEAPEQLAAFCEADGIEPPPGGFPSEQWFTPQEGLRTFRVLLAHASELTAACPRWAAGGVSDDLQQFEEVLARLEQAGIRWHLAVDF